MSLKRSKVHPKYKTNYRVRNCSAYDRSLVARGDITLWITPEALDAWRPARTGMRGAHRVLVPGQRIYPSERTGFQSGMLMCGSPAWSPDGKRIAFMRALMTTKIITSELWIVNVDGSGAKQITQVGASHSAMQPCFSPDSRQIVFTVVRGRTGQPLKIEELVLRQFNADVYALELASGQVRRLTNDGISAEPPWGP